MNYELVNEFDFEMIWRTSNMIDGIVVKSDWKAVRPIVSSTGFLNLSTELSQESFNYYKKNLISFQNFTFLKPHQEMLNLPNLEIELATIYNERTSRIQTIYVMNHQDISSSYSSACCIFTIFALLSI
jgi:hypothetical protein